MNPDFENTKALTELIGTMSDYVINPLLEKVKEDLKNTTKEPETIKSETVEKEDNTPQDVLPALNEKINAVCNKYEYELMETHCYHGNEIVIKIETYDGLDDFVIHGYLEYDMKFSYEFNTVASNEHYFPVDFYKMLGEIGEVIEGKR